MKLILAGTVLFLGSLLPVYADCVLDDFDKTPPAAISGDVDNDDAIFRWGSDFDRKNGLNWVWHYIENRHATKSLSVNWQKAGLKQLFVKPLPPGKVLCGKYPVSNLGDNDIDDDSPIIYGNNDSVQRAAVYKKTEEKDFKSENYISTISSSYLDNLGSIKDFEVSFFYSQIDNVVNTMGVIAPEKFYVGIADSGSYWSDATIDSLAAAAKSQNVDYDNQSLPGFAIGNDTSKAFFSEFENSDQPATIVQGTIKGWGEGAKVTSTAITEVVIFDEERNPVASSFIALPVTK